MTKDEIIAMAKEAGRYASHQTGETGEWNIVRDLRFAALVAAKEREACAQVCYSMKTKPPNDDPEDVERGFNAACRKIESAIRARDNT